MLIAEEAAQDLPQNGCMRAISVLQGKRSGAGAEAFAARPVAYLPVDVQKSKARLFWQYDNSIARPIEADRQLQLTQLVRRSSNAL